MKNVPDKAALELADTDDMIAELMNRHDAFFLVALKDLDEKRDSYLMRWQGHAATCVGLLKYGEERLMRDFMKDVRAPLENEET